MRTEFSILIVTYNGLTDLRRCIASLQPQISSGWEIVVVDNGSSDGTAEYLKTIESDCIRCILLPSNTGFAAANNTGFEHAQGAWIFLLNNDTSCCEGSLAALEAAVDRSSTFSIFSCRMLRMSDRRIDNLGIRFTRSLRGVQIGSGLATGWPEPREVFGASGGAMLVNRTVIEDIGLFDPYFFAYQEDVDFAVRARLAGYRCCYLPNAIVLHKGGSTSSKRPPLYRYYNQRNMEVVLRNLPSTILWKYGLLHACYVVYQIAKWTCHGDGVNVSRAKRDGLLKAVQSRKTRPVPRISAQSFSRMINDCYSNPLDAADEATPTLTYQ